jgi:hypothetical protein
LVTHNECIHQGEIGVKRVDPNLAEFLHENRIKQCTLAQASGYVSASRLNAVVNGWQLPGPTLLRRIKEGLRNLGVPSAEIAAICRASGFSDPKN